jgi:hypothetical protein
MGFCRRDLFYIIVKELSDISVKFIIENTHVQYTVCFTIVFSIFCRAVTGTGSGAAKKVASLFLLQPNICILCSDFLFGLDTIGAGARFYFISKRSRRLWLF